MKKDVVFMLGRFEDCAFAITKLLLDGYKPIELTAQWLGEDDAKASPSIIGIFTKGL